MASHGNVLYEKEDGVGILTLNRPEVLNAMVPGMHDDISAVLDLMAADEEVLVTIITGAGRSFCSGAYLKDPARVEARPAAEGIMRPRARGTHAWDYPKPIVGAINGPAYGAGFNLALCSDIIVVSTEARFCFPMSRLGTIPAWPGVQTLALYIGKARATEVAMTARPIEGKVAYQWGLANSCVEPDELMDEARRWALELAGKAPMSLRLIKEEVHDSCEPHFNRRLNRLRFDTAYASADRLEGVRAWKERRLPNFSGK